MPARQRRRGLARRGYLTRPVRGITAETHITLILEYYQSPSPRSSPRAELSRSFRPGDSDSSFDPIRDAADLTLHENLELSPRNPLIPLPPPQAGPCNSR